MMLVVVASVTLILAVIIAVEITLQAIGADWGSEEEFDQRHDI